MLGSPAACCESFRASASIVRGRSPPCAGEGRARGHRPTAFRFSLRRSRSSPATSASRPSRLRRRNRLRFPAQSVDSRKARSANTATYRARLRLPLVPGNCRRSCRLSLRPADPARVEQRDKLAASYGKNGVRRRSEERSTESRSVAPGGSEVVFATSMLSFITPGRSRSQVTRIEPWSSFCESASCGDVGRALSGRSRTGKTVAARLPAETSNSKDRAYPTSSRTSEAAAAIQCWPGSTAWRKRSSHERPCRHSVSADTPSACARALCLC